MPSPFPGMDPYLEAPSLWTGVHDRLIVHMGDVLQPLLPEGYYVDVGERVYFERPSEVRRPDVTVVETGARDRSGAGRGAATLEADEPLIVAVETRRRETLLEIRTAGGGQLVTAIELLSPSNKAPYSHGRQEYLEKRDRTLADGAHVVEIDLLRLGPPVVLAPVEELREQEWFDYVVSVSRAPDRRQVEVYPFTIRQPLPRIKIPLRAPDPDVTLDLPAAMNRLYDNADYRRRIDYGRGLPPPPLRPGDSEWMEALLR